MKRRVAVAPYDAEIDMPRKPGYNIVRMRVDVAFSSFADAEAFWESIVRLEERGKECSLEYEHFIPGPDDIPQVPA